MSGGISFQHSMVYAEIGCVNFLISFCWESAKRYFTCLKLRYLGNECRILFVYLPGEGQSYAAGLNNSLEKIRILDIQLHLDN